MDEMSLNHLETSRAAQGFSLRLFPLRNWSRRRERAMGHGDFRHFGHAISRLPQNEARPQFHHTTRTINPGREQAVAISPAEPWAEFSSEAQNYAASNDLRGGVSGIARPVAGVRRPRQNSQDRSLNHPGSALNITLANR